MKSMTGFSYSTFEGKYGQYVIEIRSVNGRYGDFSFKMPRFFWPYEEKIKKNLS